MERGRQWSVLLALVLLATSRAEPLDIEILTEWNGAPVEHVPISLTLDSSSQDVLQLVVQAPFFDDPAPPAPENSSYIGLWDYEVVELFLLNDADQYIQVEFSPRGQYFVMLFDGVRNVKRFSLPLTVSSEITGGADASWTATAEIPTDYLPYKVTRVNAYATHGAAGDRHYEAYSPAPSTASEPDYHNLEYFAPIDLDVVIPDLSSRPISELWRNAVQGIIRYSIDTVWNGTPIDHAPVVVMLGGNADEVIFSVEAPFFDDPAPDALPGEPFNTLWNYEVVEVFFLNDENQYLEVEVGPHGQHLDLLLWTKNDTYNQMRHSLPMSFSSVIDRDTATWTGTARIPVDYLPPKVTRFNAYCKHIPGAGRHEESLYPQDATDEVSDFHALKYFRPIDMNSVVPGQSERPMSQLWQDTIQGIFRYEVAKEWNSVNVAHPPTVFTLEGFEAGVELNITAPFYNDPAPGGTPGEPFYGLWDYEVVEMFFLNDNEEYLEVELGPWGEHLLLMLKGERNAIKHSLPLDYVVTTRENGTSPLPGTWQASALIPPGYFPPNVSRMNAYAIHGTGDDKHYEALYPAPLDDPRYPAPDFHRLELFQKMDFEFLVVDNSQYSDLWLEAIANATTPAPALAHDDSIIDEFTRSSVGKGSVETNELFSIETTTVASEDAIAETSGTTQIEVTVTEAVPLEDSQIVTEPVPVDRASGNDVSVDAPANDETVDDVSVIEVPIEDGSTDAIAKEFTQTVSDEAYDSTTIRDTQTTDLDFEVTTMLPRVDDEVFTTVIPEVTTTEGARKVGVPQPELVKEARRQDVDKPTGNLFRPIPARAPPRTPHPTKLDEKSDVMTSFMPSNDPFSNAAIGMVQQPHFSQQHSFPPPSFFNLHSPFARQPFPNPSQTTYINGQPVAIQGQAQLPIPLRIQLMDQASSTPTLFLPQQPHLDHLVHHRHQQEQVLQEPSQNLLTTPHQQIDLLQETNEILPDRIQDSKIPSPATGTEIGHPVLISQDIALPASSIQHSVPHQQQVQSHAIQQEQPHVHSHVIEEQEDSLSMVQEGPIENPVQPIIDFKTPLTHPQQPLHQTPLTQPQQPLHQTPLVQPQHPLQPIIRPQTTSIAPQQQPVQPLIGSKTPFIQPQKPIQPMITPHTQSVEPEQPVQPTIEPQQPLERIQPETSPEPIADPQQSIVEQPVAPSAPVRRPAPLLPSVGHVATLRRPVSLLPSVATERPFAPTPPAPSLPSVATERPPAPAPPVPSPPSVGRPGVVPPTATPHKQPSHYNCEVQGLHSDPILCPIFHECVLENNEWQVYTWRCPRGKYFDDVSLTCVTGFC